MFHEFPAASMLDEGNADMLVFADVRNYDALYLNYRVPQSIVSSPDIITCLCNALILHQPDLHLRPQVSTYLTIYKSL